MSETNSYGGMFARAFRTQRLVHCVEEALFKFKPIEECERCVEDNCEGCEIQEVFWYYSDWYDIPWN